MKTVFYTALLAVILVSCSKDELETSTTPQPGTCIVSGNVKANLNTANDTIPPGGIQYENVNGSNITFVVNSADLEIHPDANFEYEMLSYTTTINNGTYSIELPAISRPYSVGVILEEFNYPEMSLYYDWNLDSSYVVTQEKLFVCPTTSLSNIVEDNNKTHNFYYIAQ